MPDINPDFLLKEELVWEVTRRGEPAQPTVQGLRKQLRALVQADKRYVKWKPEEGEIGTEYEGCTERLNELWDVAEELLQRPPVGESSFRNRVLQRLNHFKRRLQELEKVNGGTAIGPEANTMLGRTTHFINSITERSLGPSSEVTQQTNVLSAPSNLSTSQSGESSALTQPLVQFSDFANNQSSRTEGASFQYDRLPNPFAPILQNLPVVDGLDTNILLSFLEKLLELSDHPSITENTLLQMIYPTCREPLLGVLRDCLRRGDNLKEFHMQVLENFIPGRLQDQLKQQLFYRPQGNKEGILEFCNSIKNASRILMLPLSERAIVQVILTSLNPEERCRLVFVERPNTLRELQKLCMISREVAYSDQLRHHTTTCTPVSTSSEGRQQTPRLHCDYCGRNGHEESKCYRRQESSRQRSYPQRDSHNNGRPAKN